MVNRRVPEARIESAKRRTFLKASITTSVIGLSGCLGGGDSGGSSNNYPEQPLRVIVPFSEGGGTDIYARQLSSRLSDDDLLGVSIEVDNIPGAASVRGAEEIYRAEPDGYTLGAFNPPSTPVSAMVADADFDLSELEGLFTHSTGHFLVAANPDYEVEDLDDLIGRYDSGEFSNLGGKTLGTIDHVIWKVMESEYGLNIGDYVGYDGTGPVIQAILSDEIPAGIVTDGSAVSAVESGDLDPVAVLTESESVELPDAPHVADMGYEGIDYAAQITRCWWLPPDASQDHIDVLTEAAQEAIESDELRSWADENGRPLSYGGPEEANEAVNAAYEEIPEVVDMEEIRQST